PHIIAQRNDRRKLERAAWAMHFALIMRDDVDSLEEHGLDRGLPRPEAQGIIRQRSVIGVEHQCRASVGMADDFGMIHASAGTAFRSVVRTPAPRPRRTQGGEGLGPSSLVAQPAA